MRASETAILSQEEMHALLTRDGDRRRGEDARGDETETELFAALDSIYPMERRKCSSVLE